MHSQKRTAQAKQAAASPEALPYWDGRLSHPLYSRVVKRLFDFLLALVLLPLALLVMLPIAALVKGTSQGPLLYRALRGGYHNKPFYIFKFRTMVVGADQYSGTTALNDPRVTRVGRVLRRTKLDEVPQLFNILRGDMLEGNDVDMKLTRTWMALLTAAVVLLSLSLAFAVPSATITDEARQRYMNEAPMPSPRRR